MKMLSEATGGTYYQIVNPESVPISFADCLGGLMAVAAQNVQLMLEVAGGGAEIAGDPMTKFPFERISASAYQIKIKDMYCGERRDIVFKVRLPALDTDKPTMIQVTLKYMDTMNEKPETASASAIVNRYKGTNLPEGIPDVEVTRHLLRLEASKAMEEAKEAGDKGRYEDGRQQVQMMLGKVSKTMKDMGLAEDEDSMLEEISTDLKEAEVGMRSSMAFRVQGKAQMESASMSHAYQRSNKVDSMLDQGAVLKSAYANDSKKSMIAQAKNAFGFS
jgi:hypothetical protein